VEKGRRGDGRVFYKCRLGDAKQAKAIAVVRWPLHEEDETARDLVRVGG